MYIILSGYSPRYHKVHSHAWVHSQVPQGTLSCMGTVPGTTRYILLPGYSPMYHKVHYHAWLKFQLSQGVFHVLVQSKVPQGTFSCLGTVPGTKRYFLMPGYHYRYHKVHSMSGYSPRYHKVHYHALVQSQVPQGKLLCPATVLGTTRYIMMPVYSPRYHKVYYHAWVQSQIPQGTFSCLGTVPGATRYIDMPG